MSITLNKQHKTYPSYKESSIAWLDTLPSDWELKRNKELFVMTQDRVGDRVADYKILSLTLGGVIFRDMEHNFGKFPADFSTYKIVMPGELVVCLFDIDVTPRTVGFSNNIGLVTGAYTVLKPRNDSQCLAKYFYFYLLFLDEKKEMLHLCTGLRNTLSKNLYMGMYLPVPKLSEQEKIVKYLDEKTVLIDKIIKLKQKQIKRLKEKRATVINLAVTRGLDEGVEMVDSGVEWVDKVPKDWNVQRLKYIGSSIIGLTYSPEDVVDSGVLVLRSSNIQKGKIDLTDCVYVNKNINKKLLTRHGDILICSRNGSKALIGKSACITKEVEGVTFGAFMAIYRSQYYRYMSYFFQSELFMAQLGSSATSTINQLTNDSLNNMVVVLPPAKDQAKITDRLDEKMVIIDNALKKIELTIDLLTEYKTSLISHIVTGKIKI